MAGEQQWTCAQATSTYPGYSSSSTKAFAGNVTAGNIVAIGVQVNGPTTTITVSQSAGTATIGSVTAGGNYHAVSGVTNTWGQMFWFPVTGTGSCTIQVALGASRDLGWHQHEFHSALTSPTIVQEASEGHVEGDGATSVTTLTTSTVTTTADGDLLVSLNGNETSIETFTYPDGAAWAGADGTKQPNHASAMAYSLDAGAAGTPAAHWVWNSATAFDVAVLWAFKATAGAGGAPTISVAETLTLSEALD